MIRHMNVRLLANTICALQSVYNLYVNWLFNLYLLYVLYDTCIYFAQKKTYNDGHYKSNLRHSSVLKKYCAFIE